jgi:hypothetical protein
MLRVAAIAAAVTIACAWLIVKVEVSGAIVIRFHFERTVDYTVSVFGHLVSILKRILVAIMP